jgi:hypothetical protein
MSMATLLIEAAIPGRSRRRPKRHMTLIIIVISPITARAEYHAPR